MLSKKLETALNEQVRIEAESSQIYLSMACWAEANGLEGIAQFMYAHTDEERMHMLKIVKYINERDGRAVITKLIAPPIDFGSVKEMFETLYKHEVYVSGTINELVAMSLEQKDFATHNFLQWYVSEQIEEESLAKSILDKINLIGEGSSGLYHFDKDIKAMITLPETI